MGAALRRTAFSPNIKERRDYSCAVFDSAGEVMAMGDHMPVHLGSMPMSVRAAIDELELGPGDVAMLERPIPRRNPSADITVVAPVFVQPVGKGILRASVIASTTFSRLLRRLPRPSRRRRRHLRRIDGHVP